MKMNPYLELHRELIMQDYLASQPTPHHNKGHNNAEQTRHKTHTTKHPYTRRDKTSKDNLRRYKD